MIEIGTLLQDRYLIEKQLGAGGMGAVYLAVDQRFGNRVAIKETFYKNDELGEAFKREARLLNSLHHPVLPHVSDFFTESGGNFLVMQFIEGEDLSEILKRESAFPVADVLRWMDSLLEALDYLHAQEPPIIHHDIKPHNLKLNDRGEIMLLDFGLAKLNSEDNSDEKKVFGFSLKYSPLEQIQGMATDARSDIFSLGATAYHLLTGTPPVDVLTRASEIVAGKPDPLRTANEINSAVSPALANVLNSALALNSAGRFYSAKAMRMALKNAINLDQTANQKNSSGAAITAISPEMKAENKVVKSDKIENFPALAAFAAETSDFLPLPDDNNRFDSIESQNSSVQNIEAPPRDWQQTEKVAVIPAKAAPRSNQSWLQYAALAALLICVGLVAYYANVTDSADETTLTHDSQAIFELNSNMEQPPRILVLPTPEVSDLRPTEKTERVKIKSVEIPETVQAAEIETVDEPTAKTQELETVKAVPPPVQTVNKRRSTTRKEPAADNPARPRVAEDEAAPDIEIIFTGRSTDDRNERVKYQKERKRGNKKRQNVSPFPF